MPSSKHGVESNGRVGEMGAHPSGSRHVANAMDGDDEDATRSMGERHGAYQMSAPVLLWNSKSKSSLINIRVIPGSVIDPDDGQTPLDDQLVP
jgi:hypothetical protein